MYKYYEDMLLDGAYECYYESEFINTSYVLGLSSVYTSVMEADSTVVQKSQPAPKVYSLKDKLLNIIKKLFDFISKLLGIQTDVKIATLSDPQLVKTIMQFTNHYQEISSYIEKLNTLGNFCQQVYRNKELTDANVRLSELEHELKEIRDIIESDNGKIPEMFQFNYNELRSKLNNVSKRFNTSAKIFENLPESSVSRGSYNATYLAFRNACAYMCRFLSETSIAMKRSIMVSGEAQFLNSQRVGTYKGINIVGITVYKKLIFTYHATTKPVIDKWGEIFIVVDPNEFKALDITTKKFALEHELAHIELLRSNKNDELTAVEKEYHCDEVAYNKLGKNAQACTAALKTIAKIGIKLNPAKAAGITAEAKFRAKNIANLRRTNGDGGRVENKTDIDLKAKKDEPNNETPSETKDKDAIELEDV